MSALDLLGIGFPLSGTLVVALLWWLFKGALPVSPEDGIDGAAGDDGGSDRIPPAARPALVANRRPPTAAGRTATGPTRPGRRGGGRRHGRGAGGRG